MTEPTVIRCSSLPNYPDCAMRWAAQNMRREIEAAGWTLNETRRGIGAANGTAVHDAAAFTMLSKIADGSLGNQTEAEQRALASLAAQVEEGPILWDDTTPERNSAERQVVAQVRMYRAKVAPTIRPKAVEEALQAEVEPGFVLSGHVDVSEEEDLHDLKTGRNQRANAAQYGAYALLKRSHGAKANRLVEDYVPRASLRKNAQPDPERVLYPVERAEQLAHQTVRRIVGDIKRFRETADPWSFLPNPNSMLCSPKFCPAHGTKFCTAWREK